MPKPPVTSLPDPHDAPPPPSVAAEEAAQLPEAADPPADDQRAAVGTPDSLPALLAAISTQTGESQPFLLVGLYAAMGRDELVALRWDQLDLATGTIKHPIPSTDQHLTLPLAAPLLAILNERRQANPGSEFVFPGRKPGTHRVGTRSVAAAVSKAAGVPFRIDDLPALFRALAAQAGAPDDVTAWLARDDIAVRLANMALPDMAELRRWVDAVAAAASPAA